MPEQGPEPLNIPLEDSPRRLLIQSFDELKRQHKLHITIMDRFSLSNIKICSSRNKFRSQRIGCWWLKTICLVGLIGSLQCSLGDEMPCIPAEGECLLPDLSGRGPALTIYANRNTGEDSTQDKVTLATCQCVYVADGAEPLGVEPTVTGTGISTRASTAVFTPLSDEGPSLIIDGNPYGSSATIECGGSAQIVCLVQENRSIDTKDASLLLYLPFQNMDCEGGAGRTLTTKTRSALLRATADLKTLRLIVEQGKDIYDPSQWQAYTATVEDDFRFLGRQGNACIEKVQGMIHDENSEEEKTQETGASGNSGETAESGTDEDGDDGGFFSKLPWANSSAQACRAGLAMGALIVLGSTILWL